MASYFDGNRTELHNGKAQYQMIRLNISCQKSWAYVLALLPLYFTVPWIFNIVRYGTIVQTTEIDHDL